ncbi:MAG: hypothetical protein U9N50_04830 [Pseudomonadota bacterium]|nr:hypothetical protein [Pseudomonadota bacterium]
MQSDAVIFIPGIKGTKLVETNKAEFDTIWSGIQYNFETIEDLELSSAYRGEYFDERTESLIRAGEIEALAYGEFLHDLKTDGRPLYIFNYDWRYSVGVNAKRLKEFVLYLGRKSKSVGLEFRNFDFITHSLGNAVLLGYLKAYGHSKMHRAVFVSPPFKGSIDIASAVIVGEGFFPGVKASFRKLIRTFPGALELLPHYTEAGRFDSGVATHSFYRFSHWQSNITSGEDAGDPLPEKFKQALKVARTVINDELQDLSQLPEDVRKRILVIARHGFDTWQSMEVIRGQSGDRLRNFYDFENGCRTNDGDGRVPHMSSCHYSDSIKTLLLDNSLFFSEYEHGFVMKDERVQKLVNRFLFRRGGRFDHSIPGGSIKEVRHLDRKVDEHNLPYWVAITR